MKKKILSLFMVIAITIFQFAPTMVTALSYELNDGDIINSYNVTSDVVTLYVGNISVDGTSTLKYLYTDKSVNTETLTEMRKILTSDYASLLPTTEGQVKVSNDNSVTVNDIFTDAGMVAINKYPSGTVSDTSSTILYNQTQFNSLATASQAEISDEATAEANNLSAWNTRKATWESDPENAGIDFPEEYVYAFNDTTTYPTTSYFIADNKGTESRDYIIRNGVVAQVNTYPINRTIIKVVNTSANVIQPKSINSLNIKVASPKVGDTATATTKPTVTLDSNPNYEIDHIAYITAYPSEKPAGEYDAPFIGTFEANKDYVVEVSLKAKDGFAFVDNNGMTLKVNGKTTGFEKNEWNADGSTYYMFFAKVQATTAEEAIPTYEYIDNTANQTYTIGTDDTATFRINADYSLFENGGKVYVDDTLVSSDNYTSKSGSTIITFTKDYMSSLSEGEHTLKVAFNNNATATTKFTVAKAEESTNNPKTGDKIMFYISMLGLSIIGLAGAGLYIKKRFN